MKKIRLMAPVVLLLTVLFLTSASPLEAGDLSSKKDALKKSIRNMDGAGMKKAFSNLAQTDKTEAYRYIFKKLLQITERIRKVDFYLSLIDKRGKAVSREEKQAQKFKDSGKYGALKTGQKAGFSSLKNVPGSKLVNGLFEKTVLSGSHIVRMQVTAGSGFVGSICKTESKDGILQALKLAEQVVPVHLQLKARLKKMKNRSDVDKKKHRAERRYAVTSSLQEQLFTGLGTLKNSGAIDLLITKGLKHNSYPRQVAAAEAMSIMSDDRTRTAIMERLKSADNSRLIALLMKVVYLRDMESAEPIVISYLENRSGRVVRRAATTLQKIGSRKAIDPLIHALARTRGETAAAIAEALERLTVAGFGTDARAWKNWWDRIKGTNKKVMRRRQKKVAGEKSQVPEFFDIPLGKTDDVVFIIDVSGSMMEEARVKTRDEPADRGDDGIGTGPGSGEKKKKKKKDEPPVGEPPSNPTIKIKAAVWELKNAIRALNSEQFFNIIFFSSGSKPWMSNRLVKATINNKKKAFKYIDQKASPGGGTNPFDALEKAFGMSGDDWEDTDLDTIFLLTDGLPTFGLQNTDRIIKEVEKLNPKDEVTINTIVLGAGSSSANANFLRRLARENGGTFRDPSK